MKKNSLANRKKEEKMDILALRFTRWVGSPASIIAHSIFFLICLLSPLFGLEFDRMLLFLTTIVSLEAIYLGIFIQFTVNQSRENIEEVVKDIDEIQEDIDEIQEDVGEIQEDIDEIQEDVDEIEEGEQDDSKRDKTTQEMIASIHSKLELLIDDIVKLKEPALKNPTIKNLNKKP